MSESKDLLARNVAIRAGIEGSRLTLSARSRAVASFDRLLGASMDIFTAALEGNAEKARAKTAIEIRIMQEAQKASVAPLGRSETPGGMLWGGLVLSEARKSINRSAVAIEALEELNSQSHKDQSPEDISAEIGADYIDEDWMNIFVRFSEDASSDYLQGIWGRILAGEIRRPRAFSSRTLRFIHELDKNTASLCELLAKNVVGNLAFIEDSSNSVMNYQSQVELETLGLIYGVSRIGGPVLNVNINEQGVGFFHGRRLSLVIYGKEGNVQKVPAIMLTQIGIEVMSLLPLGEESTLLMRMKDQISKEGISRIGLGEKLVQADGRILVQNITDIWIAD